MLAGLSWLRLQEVIRSFSYLKVSTTECYLFFARAHHVYCSSSCSYGSHSSLSIRPWASRLHQGRRLKSCAGVRNPLKFGANRSRFECKKLCMCSYFIVHLGVKVIYFFSWTPPPNCGHATLMDTHYSTSQAELVALKAANKLYSHATCSLDWDRVWSV